ncbi:TPM domain-containing protein [Mastigocoleus testarum]|uniref:TPM domain-containing protein n=1 Tax=Mastigocoleus testarum BC008 TaxID=371196 RepID=A0A0V7ZVR3_9CYAN|nr:TPM domain-containing protein [Mastigocoleus testarum]KST68298.1 hypothetical protein BC008_00640 [Mastigocoleus testarum BC008]KST68310.1 hypothetical protein BC008_00705 [Mastigocoleus testarum BC008]
MKINLLKKLESTLLASSLCLAVFLFPLKSEALTVQEVPNPRQEVYGAWVTDMAEILTDSTEAQLNQMIEELEAKNGTEIAVVTVAETAPAASPKEFTTELFNYWGIGKKEQDNGVLFLISVGDRRVEIETGYGVEGILPDAKVGKIIDTKIKPQFKQGDFDGGTLAGTKALVIALGSDRTSSVSDKPSQNIPATGFLLAGGILALAIGTAVILMSRRVRIKPIGRSRLSGGSRIFFCADCQQKMKKVDNAKVQSMLSQPEKIAQDLGSLRFQGWRCPKCSQDDERFHFITYVSSSPQFKQCPKCNELTVTWTKKILEQATHYSSGQSLITDKCHCCNYSRQGKETIPRLPPGNSSWSGSSGGGFGGGSSGGGGAGGDW